MRKAKQLQVQTQAKNRIQNTCCNVSCQ